MKRTCCLTAIAVLITGGLAVTTRAAEWKPKKGPLMTRWAKEVSPDNAHPEYPRPQIVRKQWKNLNGLWQLAFAEEGEAAPVGKDLPEQILVPFPVESALSGVMKRAKRLWYRRTFEIPEAWKGQRVLLHFQAVDWEATVYVNGEKLATHRGGYDAFTVDATDALKADGPQELIVGVFDPASNGYQPRGKQVAKPGGIWYTPTTGIWQTVWMEPVSKWRIEGLKLTPDVDNSKLIVTHDTAFVSRSNMVDVVVLDGEKEVAKASGTGKIEVSVPEAKLWSPEDPFLYNLKITLRNFQDPTKIDDEVTSYFGMRKIALGKDEKGITRMMFNGKPVFQVGPLDQGFWPDGLYTAPTDDALRYDVEVTKKLGFNMTRKHVKIEPARWYYWCDKLGLLVWQDMPNGDRHIGRNAGDLKRSPESAENFNREYEALIDGRYNHPSIIMWVVFNEGWGQFDTKRLCDWTRKKDPTRLINCASGWALRPFGDIKDVHAYPGPRGADPTETQAAVLGEFGGLKLAVKGHMWSEKSWGYRTVGSPEQLAQRYESLWRGMHNLKDSPGMCAAIYTQITDVEVEANGLLTYDRAVIKGDVARMAAAVQGRFPKLNVIVPDSRVKAQTWRYTLEKPEGDWKKADFDDSKWKQGPGGFGTKDTPGTVVRTEWKSEEIWIRREVALPEKELGALHLTMHHDEDAEVYLNGVLATAAKEFTTDYTLFPLSEKAKAALKPGKNVIAVHCKQTMGGQYIDVGLGELEPPK